MALIFSDATKSWLLIENNSSCSIIFISFKFFSSPFQLLIVAPVVLFIEITHLLNQFGERKKGHRICDVISHN